MKRLNQRQKAYIDARKRGENPTTAAQSAGYNRCSSTVLEKNPLIAVELMATIHALQPTIPKALRVPVAPKIPETEIMTIDELCWFLSEMVREMSYPPQVRLAAGKILADVRQFGNPTTQPAGVSINLGSTEKNL
jgi:hypothetical protein